jgi:transcriptional regulator with XRE-family HTH domain
MSRYPQLAQLIRATREQLQLSIRDVAKLAEISAAMLSRIETDGVSAGANTLIKLAQVMHLDADLLLLFGYKLPPDIEQMLFSGDPQPRLKLLKQLRQKLSKL